MDEFFFSVATPYLNSGLYITETIERALSQSGPLRIQYIIKGATPFEYHRDFIRKEVYGHDLGFIQQESTFWRSTLLKQIDAVRLNKFKFAGDFYLWHKLSKRNKPWIVDSIVSEFRPQPGNKIADLIPYKKVFNSVV